MARRNGRSYVVRGETPKRYWEPSQGDVVYIEGVRTKLGRPWHGEGGTLFPLSPPVRGTTAMSQRNIKAIARVEEGKGLESVGSTATFSYGRQNPEPVTPVIFRKFPASEGGEVISLFPYDQEDYGRIGSYMHTGQHGAASHMLVYRTKLATPAEYADLKRELEGIGYRLKVIKRTPAYRAMAKAAARSREGNPRQRKTRDVWVVQGNYGYGHGWEDLTAEETYSQARQRLKEYRENEPGTPVRIKLTTERIETGPTQNPAARLIPGDQLTPGQINQVKAAFIYRLTYENQLAHPNRVAMSIGKGGKVQMSDDQWIRGHAFRFNKAGRLAARGHAAPVYMAKNPRHAGPSAIPAKWTPARVSRVGGQIQIRTGGRR